MGKYYVGQRVRIKYSTAWPELTGQEGTVVGEADSFEGKPCYLVAPDSWGTHIAPKPVHYRNFIGTKFGPYEEQLEPLTHTPSAEDILKLKGLPDRDCPLFELLTLESNVQKDSA